MKNTYVVLTLYSHEFANSIDLEIEAWWMNIWKMVDIDKKIHQSHLTCIFWFRRYFFIITNSLKSWFACNCCRCFNTIPRLWRKGPGPSSAPIPGTRGPWTPAVQRSQEIPEPAGAWRTPGSHDQEQPEGTGAELPGGHTGDPVTVQWAELC